MKKLLAPVVLTAFILIALFTPAQGDETGWFFPRNHDDVPWEGLQIAKGASPDVPYVSTPHAIVDEMVRLADVKASDVVYDLGCGDGRLVIAAVKKTGCRGVGIDIDPERIKESRANARAAGVEDRVRFVEQNFFASDIREATVMLIYLFPDVNIRLRGKFLSEMKPGSRLVSHAFDMGDWKPDNSASIGAQRVYYWVIPANATGRWKWTLTGGRQVCLRAGDGAEIPADQGHPHPGGSSIDPDGCEAHRGPDHVPDRAGRERPENSPGIFRDNQRELHHRHDHVNRGAAGEE